MREVGFRPDSPGGMGEYMILEESYTHKIPADWPYELGAWVETFNVGYWGVWGNGCDPDASDNCVIIGAGPIGLCASMVCKTAGAQVVVTDPMPARRETIQKYGADFTIDPRDIGDDPAIPNYVKKIYECFGGKIYREGKLIKREGGPTIVIECSGNDAGIASVFDIAGHSARVGFVGHSIGRKVPVEIGKTIWSTLKMKGSGGTSLWFPRTIRFLSRIKDKYDFAALNTHHFNFKDIHKAFDVAVHDKANARKVMLTFDE
jgi:L-iditol 2-dehydrogenase